MLRLLVLNATLKNISWQLVLLVGPTKVPALNDKHVSSP
jgi:hypothetical protein